MRRGHADGQNNACSGLRLFFLSSNIEYKRKADAVRIYSLA